MRLLKTGALAALLLSGCASLDERLNGTTGPVAVSQADLEFHTTWKAYLGYADRGVLRLNCPKTETDDQGRTKLLTLSLSGRLFELDEKTGSPLRHLDLGEQISAPLGQTDEFIYVGSDKGTLYKISKRTFEFTRTRLPFAIYAEPAFYGTSVFVHTAHDDLFSLDQETLKLKWRAQNTPARFSYLGEMKPLILDKYIAAGLSDGRLQLFDALSGAQVFEVRPGHLTPSTPLELQDTASRSISALQSLLDIDGSVISPGENSLIVSAGRGGTQSYDLSQGGRLLWESPHSSPFPLVLFDNRILLGLTPEFDLFALDLTDGHLIYENKAFEGKSLTYPNLVKDSEGVTRLVLADNEGYVYALDPQSGKLLGRSHPSAAGFSPCTGALENAWYASSSQGYLYRLTLKSK